MNTEALTGLLAWLVARTAASDRDRGDALALLAGITRPPAPPPAPPASPPGYVPETVYVPGGGTSQ